MTVLDDKIPAKVLSVLTKYGMDATVSQYSGDYDAELGDVTSGVTTQTVKMSPPTAMRKLTEGDNVEEGDAQSIIPASGLTFAPAKDMQVTAGGHTWDIVSVEEIFSGELVAAYQIQLRN